MLRRHARREHDPGQRRVLLPAGIAVALQLLEAVAPDARLLIVGAVALVGGAGLGLAFGLLDHVLYRRALKPAFDAMLRRMRRSRSPRESRIDATQE